MREGCRSDAADAERDLLALVKYLIFLPPINQERL